jgi:bifunctional NMN adenylyltransferase/nudix hydrolase
MNQYPAIAPTVDIAIVRKMSAEDEPDLLLARKPTEQLLRFIGGFATPGCNSYEEDARREVKEESGVEIGDLYYVGSINVDDWRYRQEQNKIRTILFVTNYASGTPRGADDVAEVRWVKLNKLQEEEIVPEHRPLLRLLLTNLNKERKS